MMNMKTLKLAGIFIGVLLYQAQAAATPFSILQEWRRSDFDVATKFGFDVFTLFTRIVYDGDLVTGSGTEMVLLDRLTTTLFKSVFDSASGTYGVPVGQGFEVAAFTGGPTPFTTEGNAFAVFNDGNFQSWRGVDAFGSGQILMLSGGNDAGVRVVYSGGGGIVYKLTPISSGLTTKYDLISTDPVDHTPHVPIPEPSTYLLFVVGILGFLGLSYRQQRRNA